MKLAKHRKTGLRKMGILKGIRKGFGAGDSRLCGYLMLL